jgi:NADPH-dependent ferric siderophore reductase
VEVENADEELPLTSPAQLDVTWLHRSHRNPAVGGLLEAALADCAMPDGTGKVWVACEASIMRNIKTHLLHERELPREQIYTHGYWKAGETNHPDHDLGKEIV